MVIVIDMDIVQRILRFNQGREAQRLSMKYRAMRATPLAFLRGTCHLFYDRLPPSTNYKGAPVAWSCGDLHLENFGSYKGDNRLVYFDINDFDEACLLPASVDLLRLMTSVIVACNHDASIGKASIHAVLNHLAGGYRQTLSRGKALWVEQETSQGKIRELLTHVQHRRRVNFLDRRTHVVRGKRRLLCDGKRFFAASSDDQQSVKQCIAQFAQTQSNPDFFRVVDVALRIAGTGSLGLERYAILVEGNGSPDRQYLLDLKLSAPSVAATRWQALQPNWPSECERVCAVQYQMQAVCVAFLHPVVWNNKPYVLRALQPAEDRLALPGTDLSADVLMGVVSTLGECIASAQLRSAGRRGSANADALIAYALKRKWPIKLTALAETMAQQVHDDWLTYCSAYDRGAIVA